MGAISNQVDRQIRLLDQSIEEVEATITLASRPDSQPRRILSHAVTGRWLRPQIEPPPQPLDQPPSAHELPINGFSAPDRSRGKTNATSLRKNKKGKKKKHTYGQGVLQPPGIPTAGDALTHTPDPNEPRYCYCDNVSYGAVRVIYLPSFPSELIADCRWCNVKTARGVHTTG